MNAPRDAAIPAADGPTGPTPSDGTVEMTIDASGRAVLRGTVPTLEDRIALGQRVARSPDVTEVVNLLKVQSAAPPMAVAPGALDLGGAGPENDPPPPEPVPMRGTWVAAGRVEFPPGP